jgi:hypothetical protein
MGGAVQKVGQAIGVDKKPKAPAPAPSGMADLAKTISKATAMDEQRGARMRGARRRGRALLSDARLNAESGVQTLGSGQQL